MAELLYRMLEPDTQFQLNTQNEDIADHVYLIYAKENNLFSIPEDNETINTINGFNISDMQILTTSTDRYILSIRLDSGVNIEPYFRDIENRDKVFIFARNDREKPLVIPFSRLQRLNPSFIFGQSGLTSQNNDSNYDGFYISLESNEERAYFEAGTPGTLAIFPSNNIYNFLIGRGLISTEKYNQVFGVPDYIKNVYGMINTDILGLLILAEQFSLIDLEPILDEDNQTLSEIDALSPVYKTINDLYVGTDSFMYRENADSFLKDGVPVFRTYFDLTSPSVKNINIGIQYIWPIEVQIRIQFVEPTADIVQKIGGRRYLRGGNLQFIISTDKDINISSENETDDRGRPLVDLFRVAQFYINKYGSTRADRILRNIPISGELLQTGIRANLEDLEDFPDYSIFRYTGAFRSRNEPSGFHHINREDVRILLTKLFPGFDFTQSSNFLSVLLAQGTNVRSVYSFTTGVAVSANLRFAPIERRTVTDPRIFNPTYGLAVTVPFTFEQIR